MRVLMSIPRVENDLKQQEQVGACYHHAALPQEVLVLHLLLAVVIFFPVVVETKCLRESDTCVSV